MSTLKAVLGGAAACTILACALAIRVSASRVFPKPLLNDSFGMQVSSSGSGRLLASEVVERLYALDDEDAQLADIMQLETIGTSVDGQDITLVRLGSNSEAPCVYVICRQHGDEAAPTEAALKLAESFIRNDEQRSLLDQVTLCIVPLANPDAADTFRRNNSAGVNLNRDWQRLSQPETLAISNSIEECQPKLIIDAHENYVWEHEGQYIQPGRCGSAAKNRFLCAVCSAIHNDEAHAGHAVRIEAASGSVGGLAHRVLSSRGIPAILVESKQNKLGPTPDINRRQRLHQIAVLTALRLVARKYSVPQRT